MEQKIAIVTGASRGIGRCVAEGLAGLGYTLALVARSSRGLEEVLAHIRETTPAPHNHLCFALDVADDKAVARAVSMTVEKLGGIDLLFNNAGDFKSGTLQLSREQFDNLLAVNLGGAFSFVRAVAPVMQRQRRGYIINVASRAGQMGFAGIGGYVASKFGFVGLGESLYRELSPLGIKVTTLCPSWVDTSLAKDAGTPLPSSEMIQPADIFRTVEWLLSLSPQTVVKDLVLECRSDVR